LCKNSKIHYGLTRVAIALVRTRTAVSSSDEEILHIDELNNVPSLRMSACCSHDSKDGILGHKDDEEMNSTEEYRALLQSIRPLSDSISMDPGSVTVQSVFDSEEASRLDSKDPVYYHLQNALLSEALPILFIDSDSSSEEFAPATFDPEFFEQLVEDSQIEVDRVQKIVEADVTGIDALEELFKLFKNNTERVDTAFHDSKGESKTVWEIQNRVGNPKPCGNVWEHFRESMKNMAASSRDFIPSLKNANIEPQTREAIVIKLKEYGDLLRETQTVLRTNATR